MLNSGASLKLREKLSVSIVGTLAVFELILRKGPVESLLFDKLGMNALPGAI